MSQIVVLCTGGDLKLSWNSEKIDEIKAAKDMFEEKVKKGWSAFLEKGGIKGEKVKVFDPDADRLILIPPISGGIEFKSS